MKVLFVQVQAKGNYFIPRFVSSVEVFRSFKFLDTRYVGPYYFTLALGPSSDKGIPEFQQYGKKDGGSKGNGNVEDKKIMKLLSH